MEQAIIVAVIAIIIVAMLVYSYESKIRDLKEGFARQMSLVKEAHDSQIAALRQMNEEQVKSQMELIREQMQTTSEKVLKRRQYELGEENLEQVSKIIDPLQRSLKDMQEALAKSKEQQAEALTRLDETIKINMQRSEAIGETADRLTRALTGEPPNPTRARASATKASTSAASWARPPRATTDEV